LGETNELPEDVITFLRNDARKLVEAGRLFVVPAQLIGCAQRFVGSSDAKFAHDLLRGAFLGSGDSAAAVRGSPQRNLIKLNQMILPYFKGLDLNELALVMDDIGDDVRPFHRRIRELFSSGDFDEASFSVMKQDAIEREIDESVRDISKIYNSLSSTLSDRLNSTSLDRFVAPRTPHLAGSNITDMLNAILPSELPLRPWIPFYKLSQAGGDFSWSSPPIRKGTLSPVNTIDFSWLAPPTIGAGVLVVKKS
jgi:hypothetical protein